MSMAIQNIRDTPGTIENTNLKKYAKPPTWEQIEDFLKEVGMSAYQFERFYGIAFNHLSAVKCHSRKNYPYKNSKTLAVKYWHIFYEKIKPAYGIGFIGDYTHEIINGEPQLKEKFTTENVTQKVTVPIKKEAIPINYDKHHRLAKLK